MTQEPNVAAGPVMVRAAEWPRDEAAAVCLLRHYAADLASGPAKICIGNFDQELASLSQLWSLPNGVLLLAAVNGEAAGCAGVKVRHDRPSACEMKRLWVEPAFRGLGLGRRLVEASITRSRAQGAQVLLLDTHPAAMPNALALYRSLGFSETERHNQNPVPGVVFLHLTLQ